MGLEMSVSCRYIVYRGYGLEFRRWGKYVANA